MSDICKGNKMYVGFGFLNDLKYEQQNRDANFK